MDIEHFFATANRGIKSMNLKRMMMGFTMLTINRHRFRLINAGMPPVYLYRKKQRSVQEIREHGLPIGAMNQSSYNVIEEYLNKGDVLLLLTDGMPELQNENKELFGYQRLQECFIQAAGKNPKKIIEHLKNTASRWINDKDPEDDVTFVVIKAK
jgi:serine phosphatase RsbU (regulator of sigma subunit)